MSFLQVVEISINYKVFSLNLKFAELVSPFSIICTATVFTTVGNIPRCSTRPETIPALAYPRFKFDKNMTYPAFSKDLLRVRNRLDIALDYVRII